MRISNKINPTKITLILTQREIEMLSIIAEQEGSTNFPSIIHGCIHKYYQSHYFNKYSYKSVGHLTPEERLAQPTRKELRDTERQQKIDHIYELIADKNYTQLNQELEQNNWLPPDNAQPLDLEKFPDIIMVFRILPGITGNPGLWYVSMNKNTGEITGISAKGVPDEEDYAGTLESFIKDLKKNKKI